MAFALSLAMFFRLIYLIPLILLSGCVTTGTTPRKPVSGFDPNQIAKSDIDRVAEAHQRGIKVIIDLVLAGLLMFVFRFFMAAEVSFLRSLATVAWSFAALSLVQTPIMLAVFTLKGDWNVDPNQIVQANPTVFFEIGDLPRWLWSLLSSLDLFTFWTVFLLATGYAVASKRGLSTGLWGVAIPWALYVMEQVAFVMMCA